MKVKMRVNLGSVDAKALRLEFKDCTAGKVVDVSEAIAEQMVKRGFAEFGEQKGIPATSAQKGK